MRTAFADLKASVARIVAITNDIDNNLSLALRDRSVAERHETTQCALTVILSGYLESFLKDVAEAFILNLCACRLPFVSLPEQIKQTHFESGGEILMKRSRNKLEWVSSEPKEIARRLGSVNAADPYELLWEAFADTKQNPGPATIKDYLERFGIKNPWSRLIIKVMARQPGWSESSLVLGLRSFIEVRNECAHSGRASNIPTTVDVRQYCELLQQTAEAIVEVLDDELVIFAAQMVPAVPLAPAAPPTATAQPHGPP